MRKFTCPPSARISGQTITAYLDNLQSYESRKVFEEHGISNVDVLEWYPLQPLLDVLYILSTQPNAAQNIVAIGMQIANYGIDPEETKNVPLAAVLEHWNEHMYANIKGADIGTIVAEKVEDTYYRVTHQTVWPDDLLYGLAYGFAHGRLPKGTNFTVWYENLDNRLDNGNADKTVICVQWE
jgi:hypothetical protein